MIYETHIDKYSANYLTPIGEVIASKNNPSVWGIRLLIKTDVEIEDSNGTSRVVAGGGVIPIIRNLKIKFKENIIGEIK